MRREKQAVSHLFLTIGLSSFSSFSIPSYLRSGDMPFSTDDSLAHRRPRLLPISIRGVTVDTLTGSNGKMMRLASSRGEGIWAFADAASSSHLRICEMSAASSGPHDAHPAKLRHPSAVPVAASIAESLNADGPSVTEVCEQLALLDGEAQLFSIEGAIHGEAVGYRSDSPRAGEINSKNRTIPTSFSQLAASEGVSSGTHVRIHR